MAAVDLNTVRKIVETRLKDEFRTGQNIPLIFNNVPFDDFTADQYIQCVTSFGASEYLTQEAPNSSTTATNLIVGLCLFNIYTKQGIGAGANFAICKRLRNLFNRITVSDVRFDAPEGPQILQSSPEGRFQTQISITFEIYEALTP
tara:strand:+ start:679 stop:1116 length:438 start_codon:yes stop_codon:yes gene_type:complete